MPRITYKVLVRRVFADTTPWIPDPEGRFAAIREKTRVRFREIDHTGVQCDDAGNAPEYVLEREILESGVERWRRFGQV